MTKISRRPTEVQSLDHKAYVMGPGGDWYQLPFCLCFFPPFLLSSFFLLFNYVFPPFHFIIAYPLQFKEAYGIPGCPLLGATLKETGDSRVNRPVSVLGVRSAVCGELGY